ncbi:hypothetical protein CBS63078_10847 [Aspergillus niger]|nr:hypothetical protein CBS133816_6939 [Aspergillus niger]KAI2836720.1 hypothetical protein CBS11350_9243 [Aspergillus niger]KAI2865107.1 hypothetical protein CBS12448_2395 [Aspergillus niger]KAI2879398.1 hypothetical protein CBS11852_10061 [Aspergillus niger]KAI2886816.1 hypothetical protein CBS63078_10847 [Aspergillus niger]
MDGWKQVPEMPGERSRVEELESGFNFTRAFPFLAESVNILSEIIRINHPLPLLASLSPPLQDAPATPLEQPRRLPPPYPPPTSPILRGVRRLQLGPRFLIPRGMREPGALVNF